MRSNSTVSACLLASTADDDARAALAHQGSLRTPPAPCFADPVLFHSPSAGPGQRPSSGRPEGLLLRANLLPTQAIATAALEPDRPFALMSSLHPERAQYDGLRQPASIGNGGAIDVALSPSRDIGQQ
jgi:hypothetical protein